jgi:hypothetical protein
MIVRLAGKLAYFVQRHRGDRFVEADEFWIYRRNCSEAGHLPEKLLLLYVARVSIVTGRGNIAIAGGASPSNTAQHDHAFAHRCNSMST